MENDKTIVEKSRELYTKVFGDFSIQSLINISIVLIANMFLPFFRTDFTIMVFLSIGWWVATLIKLGMNTFVKKTFLEHKTRTGIKKEKDIITTHESIQKSKEIIESRGLYRFLPKVIRDENIKNKLNDLSDYIDDQLTKKDAKVSELLEKKQTIYDYRVAIENGNDDIKKRCHKALELDLAKMKTNVITEANLYSINDNKKLSKSIAIDLPQLEREFLRKTAVVSIVFVVGINMIGFALNGFSWDAVIDVVVNLLLIVYSAWVGTRGGEGILNVYRTVANYKDAFLKSFINKADYYTKPSEEELASVKLEKELEEKRKREEEELKAKQEEEKREREYDRELKREQMRLEHELKLAEIRGKVEQAKANTPTYIVEQPKSAHTSQVENVPSKTIIEVKQG